ncbi:MAG: hypothetical protein ABI193_21810 [Minicystis sp.]
MSDMAYAVHTRTCTYLLDEDGICRWTLSPSGAAAPGTDRCVGAQFVASLDLNEAGGLVGELRIGAAALFARVEGGRYVLLRTAAIEHVEFRGGEGESVEEPAASAPQPASRKVANPLQQSGLMEPRLPQPSFPHLDQPIARAVAVPHYASAPPPAPPSVPRPSTPPPVPSRAQTPSHAPPPPSHPPPPRPIAPPPAPPPPAIRAAMPSAEEIDVEELSVEDLVTFSEVTLTIPLYRPETQTERPAPPPRRGMIGQGKRLR